MNQKFRMYFVPGTSATSWVCAPPRLVRLVPMCRVRAKSLVTPVRLAATAQMRRQTSSALLDHSAPRAHRLPSLAQLASTAPSAFRLPSVALLAHIALPAPPSRSHAPSVTIVRRVACPAGPLPILATSIRPASMLAPAVGCCQRRIGRRLVLQGAMRTQRRSGQ